MNISSIMQKLINPEDFTILIVDDNPSNIGIMQNYLRDIGFHIIVARKGESAIRSAMLSNPDLILLDVMMPGLDGFQTCQRMKSDQKFRDIPVIFITALKEIIDIVKGFESGGVDYILKPFKTEEVYVRIINQLTLSTLKKLLEEQNSIFQKEIEKRKQIETELLLLVI